MGLGLAAALAAGLQLQTRRTPCRRGMGCATLPVALLLAAVLLASALACQGRTLRQAPPCPPESWDCGSTSQADRLQCGRLGQKCCEFAGEDEYTFVSGCADDSLYCADFPNSDLDVDGEPPSLCLPRPPGCGRAGGVCCPLTGNKTNGATRCVEENTLCLSPASESIFGDLTYELYQQLKGNPLQHISAPVALSVWGSCITLDAASCGLHGGLCGPPLPWPAPLCPETSRGCPDGHFCEVQERQWEVVGLCVDIPPGCGQLGSGCCPHGNYSSGSYDIPFCWDADVYCAAQADNITNSACLPMPKSPEDCGAPGGPCCPATYGIITDKQLPSQCQEGAYCGGTDEGGTPTCVANPPDCGRLAHACCAVDGRSSTLYSCDEGLYCPEPGDTSSGGSSGGGGGGSGGLVLLSDVGSGSRVCQECTPLVDQRYHTVCGIGIDSGGESEDYYYGDYAPAPAPGPDSPYWPADPDPDVEQPPVVMPGLGGDDLPPLGPPSTNGAGAPAQAEPTAAAPAPEPSSIDGQLWAAQQLVLPAPEAPPPRM